VSENQMTDPGRFGDDGDVALDAALAAADEDMLAAIGNRLELDVGLARLIKDPGGSSATHPGTQAPAYSGKDRRIPDATSSRNPSRRIHTGSADAASTIRVAVLIRDLNASDKAVEDLYLRARHAADIAARSEHAAGQAAASARRTADAHRVIQAGQPRRHAPWPRQVTLALGYRALRAAETVPAWRARRQARRAGQAARIARAAAGRNAAERDRLIDAYLGQVRRQIRKTFPAGRQLAVESGVRKHLLGERPLMELESWCPSRAALPRRLTGLRTGSWITRWIPAR
jgi:hypothetical protein